MPVKIVEAPAPADSSCREHPSSARGLVNRGIRKVRCIVAGSKGRVREKRERSAHCRGGGILAKQVIGFVSNKPWETVAVMKPSPGIYPVGAVCNHVRVITPGLGGPQRLVTVLDASQCLLWSVYRRIAPLNRLKSRVRNWVESGVSIADNDTVGHTARGCLQPHLPLRSVSAKESKVDSCITRSDKGVKHRFRPVFVMADRKNTEIVQQHGGVGMGVDIGCVGHVISRLLHPAHEGKLPREKGLAPS